MAPTTTSKPIFSGRYVHGLDPKKRVTIPADWRAEGHEQYYIIPHQSGGCLVVMPPDEFERMKQTVESKDVPEEKRRMFLREFYSRSEHVVSDKQGRLLLSEEHCKRIGLEGEEVVMLGGATRFEIWNPKRREAMQAEHDAVFQELAGGMGL